VSPLLASEISCHELVELITDYLEGALPRRARARFDAHIRACPHCNAYLDQVRTTIRLTGRLREDDLDPAARATLLAAFRDWKLGS
jgi:anti-sigma factor RsiW